MGQSALSAAYAPEPAVSACLHCGQPAGRGVDFCCPGCAAAHGAAASAVAAPQVSGFALPQEDGSHLLTLAVSGIHCAACIQAIEGALLEERDVQDARVHFSTGRVTFAWRGARARGDALAAKVAALGYAVKPFDAAAAQQDADAEQGLLLRCLAVAGFASGNIMLLSLALWSTTSETMGAATRDLFHWVSALIALPAVAYAGRPFFASALAALRRRRTNMDVPISLGVLLACAMSLSETLRHGEHAYFDSAVMLLFFLLIGRYLDARAKGRARASAQALLAKLSGSATVLRDGGREVLPIRELREGMLTLVAAGENIPADGVVTEGTSDVDMSLITGESLPQPVNTGDRVFAGTVNMTAPLRVTLTKAGQESLLNDIVALMEKAGQGQARYVRIADRAARLYTPVVHALALATFLGWWQGMGMAWQTALLHAVTVLIITCPCALGLAVPVVQVLASGALMRRGVLLKSGDALEKLAAIDTVAFDKTGTLTLGTPALQQTDATEAEWRLAASLAAHSRHPLSKAVTRAWEGPLPALSEVKEVPGCGVQGRFDGREVRLGSAAWCGADKNHRGTALELWLAQEGKPPVRFTFADRLRQDAKEVIASFRQAGVHPLLLSGDRAVAVAQMAREVGIEDARAALSPVEKYTALEALAREGRRVCMVGDGLNDAPSLAAAHVSISPSTAMDISQNTADMVFQGQVLAPVLTAWRVARRAQALVRQNFTLAVLYNLIAIPLAVMGQVTPLVAAAAMSGSSLVVIGNSFRLKGGH